MLHEIAYVHTSTSETDNHNDCHIQCTMYIYALTLIGQKRELDYALHDNIFTTRDIEIG